MVIADIFDYITLRKGERRFLSGLRAGIHAAVLMDDDKLLAEMQALRDRITGITGAAVASRDGLIIREDTGGVNPDNLAALTSAALSLAQRLAREAGQGTLREAVTRSSGGYVAIYAIGTSAVLVLLGDEGLDVTRLHRESRSVVENIEKLLA